MKKNLPYFLMALVAVAAITLFITGNRNRHRFDDRITLNKQHKIPYGTYVAFQNLKFMFPIASIVVNTKDPEQWDSVFANDTNQLLVVITDRFSPGEDEMDKLLSFAKEGNTVFISSRYISSLADRYFRFNSSSYNLSYISVNKLEENVRFNLSHPPFSDTTSYSYPGISFYSYFSTVDSTISEIFGTDKLKRPDFIHLRTGKGHFYIHLEPLAFSNYFLLHKNNVGYYEKIFSLINHGTKKVIWDEYFINKIWKEEESAYKPPRSNWLNVLFRYPALAAALLTAIFTMLLYILLEAKRKQRYIPIMTKPKNESLDFVKTIGRLYFEKGDHLNLCRKMAAYFLEHVRNRYKLPTNNLDDTFIQSLQFKTGIPENEIFSLVSFIRQMDSATGISDRQLESFHKQLESFYKTA
jgi:hypothetical protein